MSKNLDYISEILQLHYEEASNGVVEKSPSRLLRGEGTEKNFYIFKIDLVGSTRLLMGKHRATYLKLAHTYLSSIDRITQKFGADPNQVEYAGDSVLAYFHEDTVSAEDVIMAACFSRAAVLELRRLDDTLGKLNLQCKVVLHFAPLLVAKIGPRANSITTAIGHPIHRVAKIEKDISTNVGRATKEFHLKVSREYKKFLTPIYTEKKVLMPPATPLGLNGLLALGLGASSPNPYPNPLSSLQTPRFKIEKTLTAYNLNWARLFTTLNLYRTPFRR